MAVNDAVVEDEVDDANGQNVKKLPPPVVTLVPSVKRQLPEIRDKCRQFYHHKLSARAFSAFVFDLFGKDKVDDVVQRALWKIDDEERRVTLLLVYPHLRSHILTHCCTLWLCINCKLLNDALEDQFNALENKQHFPVDLFSLELLRDWDAWIETLQRVMPPHFRAYLWRWRHAKQCRRVVQEIEWKRCNYGRKAYFKSSVLVNATQLSFWQTHTRSRHMKKKKSVVVAIGLSKTK
ncbi:hypothetical protein FI667_g5904, partial [Globisporangium splendens]